MRVVRGERMSIQDTKQPRMNYVEVHSANTVQVGGTHYTSKKVQPWEAMEAWMTPEQFAGFLRGNAIKYLARCDDKGGVEDLKKARHYLDKLIEVSE